MEASPFNLKNITEGELEAIERIFKIDLPKSPIDLDIYSAICEGNIEASDLLTELIEKCLNYTVDVSNMERYVREHEGDKGEDFQTVDSKRSITHDSMIDSANIFSRYLLKNNLIPESFVTWDTSNRGAYGKFAILLTLNIFKDKILIDLVKKRTPTGEVNIQALRDSTSDKQELLVLDYVDILCSAENEDRSLSESEKKKLSNIEKELKQTPDKILGAFHVIYMSRY